MASIRLSINQREYKVEADPQTSLLTVLREHLDLTGSKYGCGEGMCGACTVLVDGKAQRSCITRAASVAGRQITTIEGLAQGERLHPVQQAFLDVGAMQCAYCTSGMIMSAVSLLKRNPSPSESEIVDAMEGNVCRCGTYPRIVSAIQQAAGVMRASRNNEGRPAPIAPQTARRGVVAPPGPSTRAKAALAQDDNAFVAAQQTLAQDDKILIAEKGVGPMKDRSFDTKTVRDGASRNPHSKFAKGANLEWGTRTSVATQVEIEPERYELAASAPYHFDLDRREFFRFLGAGVLVVSVLKSGVAAQESGGSRRGRGESLPKEIDAWLHINEDGKVTVYTGKVEVGQNIRTSLTQAVAEELHVALDKIDLVMGDTKLTPFDMGTFGSRTTPTMNLQLRRVAAAARDALVGLAAAQWKTDAKNLVAEDGRVRDRQTNRTLEYAALTKGQQIAQMLPDQDPLIPPKDWKIAGQSIGKVDGRDFVTGRHRYPSDQNLPEMWYGKVLRPPAFGATLTSIDMQKAEGMLVSVVRDGDFVGVSAPSTAQAEAAVAAIQAEWKSEPQISNKELFDSLRKNTTEGKDPTGDGDRFDAGSIDMAMAAAEHKLQQTYTVNYIAHVPLEPRAALAKWDGDELTVWTGTQRPFGVRGQLGEAFRIPEEKVHVLMPDMGSGYGGKHTGETAIEAARLARAAKRPVKVVWTREEEFTWAYFRPAGVIDISSGMSADGTITAWEFHNYNSGSAGMRSYYNIPNQRIVFHATKYPLRQGSYRALAATANHFARESHMDEMAHALKMDPLEFRLKNLKEERLRAVFEAAAKKFGWGRTKAPGQGFGMGGGYEKLGYIATFAEVQVDRKSGEVKVARVVTAFDCGAVVNPEGLRNQIEGSNVQGLGGALFEAIQFDNGKILNGRMSEYRVPRFSDVPVLETVLVDRKDQPSVGAGECPMVGLAPALGNAIFDACGVRLRGLPMVPDGLKAS